MGGQVVEQIGPKEMKSGLSKLDEMAADTIREAELPPR